MSNKIMQDILRKVKANSSKGCTLNDFAAAFPKYRSFRDSLGAGSGEYHPPNELRKLVQWGLLEAHESHNNRLVKSEEMSDGLIPYLTFYLTDFAIGFEDAFDINLTATPFFDTPERSPEWTELFMIMPFDEALKPVFDNHIQKVAIELDLSLACANVFLKSRPIMKEVWSRIYYATMIIADCTGSNPNVFYEIGIAHTLGKETILISQSPEDIKFDLHQHRAIIYKYPDGMVKFEGELKSALLKLLPSRSQ